MMRLRFAARQIGRAEALESLKKIVGKKVRKVRLKTQKAWRAKSDIMSDLTKLPHFGAF